MRSAALESFPRRALDRERRASVPVVRCDARRPGPRASSRPNGPTKDRPRDLDRRDEPHDRRGARRRRLRIVTASSLLSENRNDAPRDGPRLPCVRGSTPRPCRPARPGCVLSPLARARDVAPPGQHAAGDHQRRPRATRARSRRGRRSRSARAGARSAASGRRASAGALRELDALDATGGVTGRTRHERAAGAPAARTCVAAHRARRRPAGVRRRRRALERDLCGDQGP